MSGELQLKVRNDEEILQDEKASESTRHSSTSDDDQNKLKFTQYEKDLLLKLKREEKGKSAKEDEDQTSGEKMDMFLKSINRKNEDISEYYEPRKFDVKNDTDGLKFKLAAKFIKDSGKSLESLLHKIKKEIQALKECFGEGKHIPSYGISDDVLAGLLFLNGCAILKFIHSNISFELKEFKINNIEESWIQQDLFLFQNQIPFQVLELLMDLSGDKKKEDSFRPTQWSTDLPYSLAVLLFVYKNNICDSMAENEINFRPSWLAKRFEKIKPVHLLDLLWKVCIHGSVYNIENEGRDDDDVLGFRLFSYLSQPKNCLEGFSFCKPRLDIDWVLRQIDAQHFRNVQELKSSGIKIKPSSSSGLKSVSFSTHCFGIRGQLKLPTLIVNHSAVHKLLNLLAYETWLNDDEKQRVTSYVHFMDILVDTEQDAKDLRAARVLRNRLSSDKEVAEVFNMIGSTGFLRRLDDYTHIKIKIEEHCNRKCAIWVAQVREKYFGNPWAFIALMGAVITLLLTFIQTWRAVFPRE